VQNSLYVQVLRSSILTVLLHGTPATGVSQTLRRGTKNGITELSQRAPPIFGRAAITLGIGPHFISSLFFHVFHVLNVFIIIWAFLHLWGVQDSSILCSKIIQNWHYVQTNTMNHIILGIFSLVLSSGWDMTLEKIEIATVASRFRLYFSRYCPPRDFYLKRLFTGHLWPS